MPFVNLITCVFDHVTGHVIRQSLTWHFLYPTCSIHGFRDFRISRLTINLTITQSELEWTVLNVEFYPSLPKSRTQTIISSRFGKMVSLGGSNRLGIIPEIKFVWPQSHFLEWRRVETVDRVFNYITFVLFYGKPIYVQTIFIIFTSKHAFLVHLWIIKMSHFLTIEFPDPNFDGGMLFLLFRKGAW